MSKLDRSPIWMRPEPGDRKPRFTREKIAEAALAIADRDGFEAVSMREVASKLGAGTMTLYHYVRTKDDLVALMDDALMGEVLVPDAELPSDWREALSAIARRTRAIYVRHPWALLAMQGARPGPNGMRHFEQCLAAVAHTSFDTATKLQLLGIIDDFVFGHALRAGEAAAPAERDVAADIAEFAKRQLETGQYPHTAALFGDMKARQAFERMAAFSGEAQRFELGLAALLDGAEQRLQAARPKAARRPAKRKR
jgi:AcrR family transcriptional regulator